MTSDDKREKALIYARQYYEQHREELNAKRRERRRANRDKELARRRLYREQHREELKAKKRAWYQKFAERECAHSRQYYKQHREEIRAHKRDYYRANLQDIREYQRHYYAENRERICAKRRTPEYRAHRKEVRKRRKIRIVSENLARVKQSLIDNKEANEKRAKQVSAIKGLPYMGDFVPRHKKFRDPND